MLPSQWLCQEVQNLAVKMFEEACDRDPFGCIHSKPVVVRVVRVVCRSPWFDDSDDSIPCIMQIIPQFWSFQFRTLHVPMFHYIYTVYTHRSIDITFNKITANPDIQQY